MATILSKYNEIDELGGGRFRLTQMLKDHCHRDVNGYWRRNVNNFVDSGIVGRPHLVSTAPFMASIDDEGHRRIHPTNDPLRYLEIGTPYIKPAAQWVKVGFSGATRTGNTITWSRAQVDLSIAMGGHFINWECELKGGYNPGQVALPVNLVGLTRTGDTIYADGVAVMFLSKPVMRDAANPFDTRPITHSFVNLQGQPYLLLTLPSLTGMIRPVIDPTLTLQPDAAAGKDTRIVENTGADVYNYGVSADAYAIACGRSAGAGTRNRGLFQFDVSSIPAGSTISSGVVTLRCGQNGSANAYDVLLYRGLVQWYEGQKNNTAPDAGQDGSTWAKRNANGAVAWAGGVGGGSGSDYVATATATTSVTGSAADYTWTVTADIALYVAGTATNYGWWMLHGSETTDSVYKGFRSSDDATASYRPKLVVEYTTSSFIPQIMRHHFIPSQLGGR